MYNRSNLQDIYCAILRMTLMRYVYVYISVPHYSHIFGIKTFFLYYDIIMLMYCVISQCFDITGYDPKLSVFSLKPPKTEIQPSINNFPHLTS